MKQFFTYLARSGRLPAMVIGLAIMLPASSTWAGPPSYLLLQPKNVPVASGGPGCANGKAVRLPVQGYAYGHFGANPPSQGQRQFGISRTYTQWSWW